MATDCSSEKFSDLRRCTNFSVSKWWSLVRVGEAVKAGWGVLEKARRAGWKEAA